MNYDETAEIRVIINFES